VDETAKHLLQLIALRQAQGNALTVTEAMAMSEVASPATIHRKLDVLREAGLIAQVFEGKNRRTKYLVPTEAADAYFAKLGQVMSKAVASA
jgi:DNA-binding MarR family transcriptional regulator